MRNVNINNKVQKELINHIAHTYDANSVENAVEIIADALKFLCNENIFNSVEFKEECLKKFEEVQNE